MTTSLLELVKRLITEIDNQGYGTICFVCGSHETFDIADSAHKSGCLLLAIRRAVEAEEQ